MKHLFYTYHLLWHRFLMLIGFLVLWQGIGWATVYYYNEDGVNYSIFKSTTKHYARVHSIDKNTTGTIRIPANITYEGETYPVTQIDVGISSAAKDIYFTRVLPNSISANAGVDETAAFEGYFKKGTIIHVPDSLYDKAIAKFGDKYYMVTDGTRIGPETGFYYQENDITFFIHPKSLSASITSFPISETLRFPSEVICNNTKYRITNININIDKNSAVKEVYFTSCYAKLFSDDEYAKGVIAHTPDSLFNKLTAD